MTMKKKKKKTAKELKTENRNLKILALGILIAFTVYHTWLIYYYSGWIDKYRQHAELSQELIDKRTDELSVCNEMLWDTSETLLKELENCESDKNHWLDSYTQWVNNYQDVKLENIMLNHMIENMPFLSSCRNFSLSHDYDIRNFNCVDFSLGCVKSWKELGYDAYTKTVIVDCNATNMNCEGMGKHAISVVEIPFESTTGEPIPPELFEPYGIK